MLDSTTRPAEHAEDDADDAFLAAVGAHVRRLRASRGMSRRLLAEASGVSERYLAQLEGGRGNASLLVLRAVAGAMSVAVDDLVDPAPERPAEYALLRERLRTAPRETLRHLVDTLNGEARGAGAAPRYVALVGLRGAGKSTLGAALAKRAGVPFIELVQEIEREGGMAVSELLEKGGQARYRRIERDALEATLARFERAVIAAGGSLVSEPETWQRLRHACCTVWLTASPDAHMNRVVAQGDHRPMADNRHAMADLERILEARRPLYARADLAHDSTDSTVDASLEALLAHAPIARFVNDNPR